MQQVIVDIPDNKMSFFAELVKNLGFGVLRSGEGSIIFTKEQLELIEIEKAKIETEPQHFVDMEEAFKELNLDA